MGSQLRPEAIRIGPSMPTSKFNDLKLHYFLTVSGRPETVQDSQGQWWKRPENTLRPGLGILCSILLSYGDT